MTTTTLTQPALSSTDTIADSLDHVFCECDPNLALCGADISAAEIDDSPWEDTDPEMCVVCVDLSCGRGDCFRCRA